MHPYKKEKLAPTMQSLAKAFEFADKYAPGGIERFYRQFCESKLAQSFDGPHAEPDIDKSGVEIVLAASGEDATSNLDLMLASGRKLSPSLQKRGRWCGNVLALYQWETGTSFRSLAARLSADELLALFVTLGSSTPQQGAAAIEQLLLEKQGPTHLRIKRLASGYTQVQLAKTADVSLRAIQQYEQRRKDINRAQAGSLYRLAQVLGCTIEDLLEI